MPDTDRVLTGRLLPLAGIGISAFVIRLFYLQEIRVSPFFTLLMGDSKSYDTWARQIAAGDWIGHDVFYQAPLYPYLLGAIYAVCGHDLFAVRIVQIILGSVSCVLIADTGRRLFSRPIGIVAGTIMALYPAAIFFDGLIQKTALDAFLTSMAVWLVGRLVVNGGRWPVWTVLGVVLAALSLTRENALVLIAVMLVWCVSGGGSQPLTTDSPARWRARASNAAALLAGTALLLLPVAIRNDMVGGGFFITTSQFGPNLYLGNNARTDGTAGSLIAGRGSPDYERQDAIALAERAAGRHLSAGEVSSYWTGQTLAFIRTQPAAWVRLMWRKTLLLWNRAEAFDTESQESYAEWAPLLLKVNGVWGHFGLLVPLAFLGIVVTWPDRRRLAIYYAVIVSYAASVVLFFIYARYRFPLVPLLILFAAAGLVLLPQFVRRHSSPQLVATGGVLLLVALLTNWPLLDHADALAVTEHNLGAALQSEGRLDDAIARYRRAIAIKVDYAPAYSNLGAAFLAKGDIGEAVKSYERALAIDPGDADAHFNLGNALMAQDNPTAAIDQFQRALETSADSPDVHTNLGLALAAVGRPDEGIAQLQTAVRLAPDSAIAERALGETLAERGRRTEAAAHLRRAVSQAPGDGHAQYALGRLLLEDRQVEPAIAALRLAVQSADAPIEAYNDLAIALASTGRLDEAADLLTRVLKARPDFEEAKRNLDAINADRARTSPATTNAR